MITSELKGHSGCKIYLCEKKGKKFVRKISKSRKYNIRLRKQAEKQNHFRSNLLKTPEIFDDGIINSLYYFDMEYINGMTFSSFISKNTIQNIDPALDRVLSHIGESASGKKNYTTLIYKKIFDLEEVISCDIGEYKRYCMDYDWSAVPSGTCHGDLTFENIIIYKSEPFLIDFLDSFIDTTYIDLSKMQQDTLLLWSWRNAQAAPIIKNIYIHNRICSSMDKYALGATNRLLVLNLLRILPYSDKKTCTMVKNRLNYIMKRLKKCEL
ncbi:MAG TPA: hypothetical protein DCM40_46430 [Maribacter sp.]|nr:hypothetical protein [Maribacter sp.]